MPTEAQNAAIVPDESVPEAACGDSPSATSGRPDGVEFRILARWSELAGSAPDGPKLPAPSRGPAPLSTPLQITPRGPQPFIIDRDRLGADIIRRELQRVREEFLKEAGKLEKERMALLESGLRKKFEAALQEKSREIERATRIINIQNAILAKVHEEDGGILPRILSEADISDDDLEALRSAGGE